MRKQLVHGIAFLVFSASLAIGCGDSAADEGAHDIAFHAEAPALPGFSYDTGPQPASGPAQLSLKLVTNGNVTVDANAAVGSDRIDGRPQGGRLALDVHLKLEGHLKVAMKGTSFDGPLPGLANIDVPIAGERPFDGLALDGAEASVTADIPETKLPDVPLGSVPGHLSITVAKGSQLQTTFHGTCASVKAGQASYVGTTTTKGSFVLKSQLVIDLPLVKPIDLPPVTVPVAIGTKPIAAQPVAVPGASDVATGACASVPTGANEGGAQDSADAGTVDAQEERCKLGEVAGSTTVDAAFVSLGASAPPVMTGGPKPSGAYRVTAATVYVPSVADAATAKGTVSGWLKVLADDYRIALDANATVSVLGQPQALTEHIASQGTLAVAGPMLSLSAKACDPMHPDDGIQYTYTNDGAGKVRLLLKLVVQSLDTYVLLDLAP